ncbi:hypothetical protein [Croceicoccus bisphenolivorans]|uniref:hypothetical protein n=1 Tax=Croceicoccus bisphenolivorans TaxID=1783232 RepID=UPI00083380F1|nr:hypothetical protein [Croceicoccus bisphenolivorans]
MEHATRTRLLPLALLLCGTSTVAGCGPALEEDWDFEGGGSTTTVTPTPSPDSSPSASPTPMQTTSYTAFDDLTGSRAFNSGCGNWFGNQMTSSEWFSSYPADPETLAHKYDASSDSWQIEGVARDYSAGPEYSYLFDPADLDPQSTDAVKRYGFIDTSGSPVVFTIARRTFGAMDAQYVRETRLVAKPGDYKIDIRCVIGVPTEQDDSMPTGKFSYRNFAVAGTAHGSTIDYDLRESTANWSVDPVTLASRITINFVGRALTSSGLSPTTVDLGSYHTPFAQVNFPYKSFGGGVYDSGWNGDFTKQPSGMGTFGGSFFGPQGSEIGMGFAISGSHGGSQLLFAGTLIGSR